MDKSATNYLNFDDKEFWESVAMALKSIPDSQKEIIITYLLSDWKDTL